MAGPKKHKNKKASTAPPQPASPLTMDQDDDDLMNDLLAQLDSQDQQVQQESANILNEMDLGKKVENIESIQKQDAKSRFKARQTRKAAMLAQSYSPDDPETRARLEEEARSEATLIQKVCDELSREVYEINPDGHCLFSAVADQLAILRLLPASQANYATVRDVAAKFIHSHPDDFIPFLPSPEGEAGTGASDSATMTKSQFEDYCVAVRDSAVWGGEPEIVALTRAFNIPIHIVQSARPAVVEHTPGVTGSTSRGVVWISYHRKLYGLGEHYNSLRPKSRKLKEFMGALVPG